MWATSMEELHHDRWASNVMHSFTALTKYLSTWLLHQLVDKCACLRCFLLCSVNTHAWVLCAYKNERSILCGNKLNHADFAQ